MFRTSTGIPWHVVALWRSKPHTNDSKEIRGFMVVKPQRGGAPRATMTVSFPAEVLTPDTKYSTPVAPVMARTPPNTIQSRLSASEHSAHSEFFQHSE